MPEGDQAQHEDADRPGREQHQARFPPGDAVVDQDREDTAIRVDAEDRHGEEREGHDRARPDPIQVADLPQQEVGVEERAEEGDHGQDQHDEGARLGGPAVGAEIDLAEQKRAAQDQKTDRADHRHPTGVRRAAGGDGEQAIDPEIETERELEESERGDRTGARGKERDGSIVPPRAPRQGQVAAGSEQSDREPRVRSDRCRPDQRARGATAREPPEQPEHADRSGHERRDPACPQGPGFRRGLCHRLSCLAGS
ncbi:MAG: hypothetical protein R2909_22900 [Gemmatimonadales bacterium]